VKPALTVAHGAGHYPVYVQPGILAELPLLVHAHAGARRSAMIADATVAALYREFLEGGNAAWRSTAPTCEGRERAGWVPLEFPPGESSKTRATWERLTDELLLRGYGRDAAIVALGGGVTGDLAGFVAATYMRGVPLVQVPTTLLAMVDSSVGGKVGVDTPHGKNLVGAFHAPAAVVADPLVLGTLPDRDYRCGLAEAVKHGLIADAGHFGWIESSVEALGRRDQAALAELIGRSIAIKAEVVAADEREAGRRAVLNAGHTVAHAIERATGYAVRHGEAVALGLIAECRLGEALGVTEPGTAARVEKLLGKLGGGTAGRRDGGTAGVDAILAAMGTDKKTRAGAPGFALARRVGEMEPFDGCWIASAPEAAVRDAVRSVVPD
jgi:3-dehydroquinate synthase